MCDDFESHPKVREYYSGDRLRLLAMMEGSLLPRDVAGTSLRNQLMLAVMRRNAHFNDFRFTELLAHNPRFVKLFMGFELVEVINNISGNDHAHANISLALRQPYAEAGSSLFEVAVVNLTHGAQSSIPIPALVLS